MKTGSRPVRSSGSGPDRILSRSDQRKPRRIFFCSAKLLGRTRRSFCAQSEVSATKTPLAIAEKRIRTVKPFRGDEKPVLRFLARNVPGHRGKAIGTPPGLDGGFTRPLGAIAVVVDRQKLKTGRRHVPFRGGAGRPARREVRIRPSRNRPGRVVG